MSDQNSMFSEAVCSELGNYVYRLIDPRNGETFYVGRGVGNRVFAHVNNALKLEGDQTELSEKIDRIHKIRDAGLEVLHIIHRHAIPKEAIGHVEAALIDTFPGLTNIQGGEGSGEHGPMHAHQIIAKYGLPELVEKPSHKLVLIAINRNADNLSMLDQTRFAWRIDVNRARKADYVLAVTRGVVRGVFKPHEWLPATVDNFPERTLVDEPKRWGFKGDKAAPDIWKYYVGDQGKRISNKNMRHVQNPIRYWNI